MVSEKWEEGRGEWEGAIPSLGAPVLDPAVDPVLAEIVRRLVAQLQPERIYLFGSRARGDARPDSDYDLMVIVPECDESTHELAIRAYRALRGLRAPKDLLVWTAAEFNRRVSVATSLSATILREGKVLHAA